jgi:probable phosphoglycerate mutase
VGRVLGISGGTAVPVESKTHPARLFIIYPVPLYSDSCSLAIRSPEDVIKRLDALIAEIREKYHNPCLESGESEGGDVLIVAHGHILRAFAMRWTGRPLTETALILEAGGVGTLR